MPGVTDKPETVDHPPHYNAGGIECIDAIEAMTAGMPPTTAFRLGNVLKYIWRHHHKGGIESLRKAEWYLRREIAAAAVANDLHTGEGEG